MPENSRTRRIKQLEAAGDVRGLVDQFRYPDRRKMAADALVRIGDSRVAEALVEELGRVQTYRLGADVMETLLRLGPVAVEPLVALVRRRAFRGSSDHDLRRCATVGRALAGIGEASIQPLLEVLAGESDRYVREFIAKVFGEIGNPELVDPLLGILRQDRSPAAAVALGRIGEPCAVTPILQAVSSLTWVERAASGLEEFTVALVLIGEPAIDPLRDALKTETGVARGVAGKSLRRIRRNVRRGLVVTHPEFGEARVAYVNGF